jgi:hypothetical protein
MSSEKLPIFKTFDPVTIVLLKDLAESLRSSETAFAMIDKLGVERGHAFINYVRGQNLVNFVKVFDIRPIGQFKPFHRMGVGTDMYDAAKLELALLTAFTFVYHNRKDA